MPTLLFFIGSQSPELWLLQLFSLTSYFQYIYIYIHILAAYAQHCQANVNIELYGSLSNLGLVGPLISFWLSEQLPVGVPNIKPHTFPYPHVVVGNAYSVIWTLNAKFQSD